MACGKIWVTWASKITIKNFQLCSIKIKGCHAPCDVNATALWRGGTAYSAIDGPIGGTMCHRWSGGRFWGGPFIV